MRPKVFAALLLSLLFALVTALPDGAAHAQRRGRQTRPAPQQAEADNSAPRRTERPKRVIVGGSSDTPQGTRQTIKSDNPLNDYSAYRSGDRFVVVLPKADAGSVARGTSGRGFSDMQVQQRGDDVVLSYRLKPGAKPRVEQKFNRLDVVFDVPEGQQQSAAQQAGSQPASRRNQPQAASESRPAGSAAQQQAQQPAARQPVAAEQPAAARRPGQADASAGQSPAGQTSPVQPQPVQSAAGQQAAVQQPLVNPQDAQQAGQSGAQSSQLAEGAQPAVPDQTASAEAQTVPSEVAQAQQPPTGTTGATAQPADVGTRTGTSVGAVVLNNWPIALALLLALVGIGLIFAARRSSALTPAVEGETAPPPALGDAGAAAFKQADGKPAVKPVPVNGSVGKSELKDKPAKKRDEVKSLSETEKTGAVAASKVEAKPAEAQSSAVESDTTVTAIAPVVAGIAAPVPAKSEDETKGRSEETSAATPSAASVEHVSARAEVRRLLDGDDYDRALIGSTDPLARQLVASELLSALSGGHTERRERARAALAEHGYLDDLLRDLREASAPAERAAAARSLGLIGDRSATPRLAAALEDRSPEVRRAAVEAFTNLRDPLAVPALEALVKREKKQKQKTSRNLIRKAIEAARVGQAAEQTEAPARVEAESATTELVAVEPTRSAEIESVESTTVESTAVESTTIESAAVESATVESETIESATVESVANVEPMVADLSPSDVQSVELESVAGEEVVSPVEAEADSMQTTAEAIAEEELTAIEPAIETAIETVPSGETALEVSSVTVEPDAAETPSADAVEVAFDDASEDGAVVAEPVTVSNDRQSDVVAIAPFSSFEDETTIESEVAADFYPSDALAEEVETRDVEIEPVVETPVAQVAEPETVATVEEWVEFDLSEASAPTDTVESESGLTPFEETSAATTSEATSAVTSEATSDLTPFVASSSAAEPIIETSSGRFLFDAKAERDAPVEPVAAVERVAPVEVVMPQADAEVESAETNRAETNRTGPASVESTLPDFHEIRDEGRATQTPVAPTIEATANDISNVGGVAEKGIEVFDADSTVPASIQQRLASEEPAERAAAVAELSRLPKDEAFRQICTAFDDEAQEVRSAAARALYDHDDDRAEYFTRALREATPDRRRHIGAAINSSGLASEAISQLTGESREKTYEAFSILFLMAKTGEVQPLLRAVEGHPNNEVRLAVVKLLALSGQKEILPAFRRLAVRGSLPTDVRSAVMEAIYQISSQTETTPA